jgi:hypothetical protein
MNETSISWDLENQNFCLWDWNLESGTIGLSSNWLHILGFELNEFTPTSGWFHQLVHPEDLPLILFQLEKRLSAGRETDSFSFRLRHKEHGYLNFESQGMVVLLKPDGSPGHVIWGSEWINLRKCS